MVAALIHFTQGANVGAPGEALYGVVGQPTVVGNSDDTDVARWRYTVIDAPPSSALTPGVVQDGTNPTWTWVPDTTDMVEIRLDVFNAGGTQTATDFRCFGVKRASGRIIPAFTAVANALNFLGQLRGWASIMEPWLQFLDTLTGGGGGGSGNDTTVVFTVNHATTSSTTTVPGGGAVFKGGKVRVVTPFDAGTVALGQSGTPNSILPPTGGGPPIPSIDVVHCAAGTVYDLDPDDFIALTNFPFLATVAGASSGQLVIMATYAVPLP